MIPDWSKYQPYFSETEFRCKHTGLCDMQPEFMDRLLAMRLELAKPMKITSGYRHWTHPTEAKKGHTTGEHTRGLCADIACADGRARFDLVTLGLKHGFHRIGIAKGFIHLGLGAPGLPSNVIWEYA